MSEASAPLDKLGRKIFNAIEADDLELVKTLIRQGEFILFQQVDPDTGEVEDEDGNFSVVIAELEEDMGVVCFTSEAIAQSFVDIAVDDLPIGEELPTVKFDGDYMLDCLPEGFGLLINATSEGEYFFPAGTFDAEENEDD